MRVNFHLSKLPCGTAANRGLNRLLSRLPQHTGNVPFKYFMDSFGIRAAYADPLAKMIIDTNSGIRLARSSDMLSLEGCIENVFGDRGVRAVIDTENARTYFLGEKENLKLLDETFGKKGATPALSASSDNITDARHIDGNEIIRAKNDFVYKDNVIKALMSNVRNVNPKTGMITSYNDVETAEGIVRFNVKKHVKSGNIDFRELTDSIYLFIEKNPKYIVMLDTEPRVYIARNHGMLVPALIDARGAGLVSEGATLLQIDSHNDSNNLEFMPQNDIDKKRTLFVTNSNCVTSLFLTGLAKDAYWVVPEFLEPTETALIERQEDDVKEIYHIIYDHEKPGLKPWRKNGLKLLDGSADDGKRSIGMLSSAGKKDGIMNMRYKASFLDGAEAVEKTGNNDILIWLDMDWFGAREIYSGYGKTPTFFVSVPEEVRKRYANTLIDRMKGLIKSGRSKFISITTEPDYCSASTNKMLQKILSEIIRK